MRLVTFETHPGHPRAGALLDRNEVLDLGLAYTAWMKKGPVKYDSVESLLESLRGLSASLLEIIRGGDDLMTDCFELVRRSDDLTLAGSLRHLPPGRILAPLPSAPLIVFFDINEDYALAVDKHLGGKGTRLPEIFEEVPLFRYGNANQLLGPDDMICMPVGEKYLDFELELGVVLGEDVRDASLEDAEDAILGYTLINDWTARDQERHMASPHFGATKCKSVGTSMGPCIVTKEEVGNPYARRCRVKVNGDLWGEGKMAGLRWSVAEMISYASEGNTLPAGTVLTTGALPGCSGLELGRFAKPGDTVEVEIDGIGSMRNKIHERPAVFRFRPARQTSEADV